MRIRVLLLDSNPFIDPVSRQESRQHIYVSHIAGYWNTNGTITLFKDRFNSVTDSNSTIEPCEFDRYIEEMQIYQEYRSLDEPSLLE